ncbi:diguanylate cyclase domain-containing protein [Acidisoma sp.]|uniref:sensor domain-containing diguanylate cyclase n=1 Tax=Acidisoma sp. TaxID=1872115 RepID=UPI003AFFFCDA
MTILPSSEEQLLEFLYACPVGLIECDEAGEISMINPHAMQHLMPLAAANDFGNLFKTLEQYAPEMRHLASRFRPRTGTILEGHRIMVELGSGRQKDEPKVLSCTLVKLGHNRLMATLADISGQVAQEQRLRQADAWFATLLDQINDYALVTVSLDGRIESANESFTHQTGYDYVGVVGRPLSAVLGNETPSGGFSIDEQLAIAARDGWHLQEGWQQRATGGRYWCQRLVVVGIDGPAAEHAKYSVVLRDVPRRGAVADDLRRMLTCDHLTGAANRVHFSRMLARAQSEWQEFKHPLSLIALDLDHFKKVNDTHGHPVGDLLLSSVAEACKALLPPRGTFARLGGEEFGVLLPRHNREQALDLAEAMRGIIADLEIPVPGGMLRVTASFGCATLDEVNGSADALLALADQRLYAAKGDGRNRVHRPMASLP